MEIRAAGSGDAAACAAIYAPYVRDTAVSFESDPPDPRELARRIGAAQRRHAWLVAVDPSGSVHGYAYAADFRTRAAYRYSCETSVYVAPAARLEVRALARRGYVPALAPHSLTGAFRADWCVATRHSPPYAPLNMRDGVENGEGPGPRGGPALSR